MLNSSQYFATEQALPPGWNCCQAAPLAIIQYEGGERQYVCRSCAGDARRAGITVLPVVSLAKCQDGYDQRVAYVAAWHALMDDPSPATLYAARLAYHRAAGCLGQISDMEYAVLREEFDAYLWREEAA